MKLSLALAFGAASVSAFAPTAFMPSSNLRVAKSSSSRQMALKEGETPIIIGVAADSGCGKSTFMRRLTNIFGGDVVGYVYRCEELSTCFVYIAVLMISTLAL